MSFSYNYFIGKNLRIVATGDTSAGMIGNGGLDYGDYYEPTQISVSMQISKVSCQCPATSDDTPKALVTVGKSLYCWGTNTYGELGFGSADPVNDPGPVPDFVGNVEQVFVAPKNVYVIKTDGTLWGAGFGERFGRGSSDTSHEYTFIQIGTDTNWVKLSNGHYRTIALNSAGEIYTFGYLGMVYIDNGVLDIATVGLALNTGTHIYVKATGLYIVGTDTAVAGLYPGHNDADITTPVQIDTATDWAGVYGSPYADAVFAKRSNGDLYYWGTPPNAGYFGLSVDDITEKAILKHPSVEGVDHLSLSEIGVTAFFEFNSIKAWGYNGQGSLGFGDYYINQSVNTPRNVLGVESPYYEIANSTAEAEDLPVAVGSGEVHFPALEVSGELVLLINSGAIALSGLRVSGSIVTNRGVAVTLPSLNATGVAVASRVVNNALPMQLSLSVVGDALVGIVADGAVGFKRFSCAASALSAILGNATVILPVVSSAGISSFALFANGTVELSHLTCFGAILSDDVFGILSMNRSNTAFTKHTNTFVGAGKLGTSQLLATADGIYSVDADSTELVDCLVEFPTTDFDQPNFKHLRSAYITTLSSGQLSVTLNFDGVEYNRLLGTTDKSAKYKVLKCVGKRGVGGRLVSMTVSNTGGAKMLLDSIEAFLVTRGVQHGKH